MKHDYAAALKSMRDFGEPTKIAHQNAIIHALRFAEKMMQEPSYQMANAGKWEAFEICQGDEELEDYSPDNDDCIEIFKAMRDAALKELGE